MSKEEDSDVPIMDTAELEELEKFEELEDPEKIE
jgi:hypothetical protein